MENEIGRVFTSIASAEQARDELLAAGFAREDVTLLVHEDEAGAMQGNFTVGDDPDVTGGHDYSHTIERHLHRPGWCTITVIAADATVAERACAIFDRLGAALPGEPPRGQG